MSNKTKGRLFVAVLLIIVGGIIFGGVMHMLSWDFTKLSTVKYETNSYEITEEYKDILIETKEALVELLPSMDGKARVVLEEQKNAGHTVVVENGSLFVKINDSKKWYEFIGINFKTPKITVYLPQSEYGKLCVKSSTGDVRIPADFAFESVDVFLSTGDVDFSAGADTVKIKTSTGRITADGLRADVLELTSSTGHVLVSDSDLGDVKIKVSTGRVTVTDVKCNSFETDGSTGNLNMKNVIASGSASVKRSTGDVKLERCDAGEIFIKTTTGSVSGTLLSDKVFLAHTSTGRADVPRTLNGGRCEISTNTGNIKIKVEA